MSKTYTREQLIKAQIEYNKDFHEHPENFKSGDEFDLFDESAAVATIDYLLSKVEE